MNPQQPPGDPHGQYRQGGFPNSGGFPQNSGSFPQPGGFGQQPGQGQPTGPGQPPGGFHPGGQFGGFGGSTPPKKGKMPLILAGLGAVVVLLIVFVGGFAWPGWFKSDDHPANASGPLPSQSSQAGTSGDSSSSSSSETDESGGSSAEPTEPGGDNGQLDTTEADSEANDWATQLMGKNTPGIQKNICQGADSSVSTYAQALANSEDTITIDDGSIHIDGKYVVVSTTIDQIKRKTNWYIKPDPRSSEGLYCIDKIVTTG